MEKHHGGLRNQDLHSLQINRSSESPNPTSLEDSEEFEDTRNPIRRMTDDCNDLFDETGSMGADIAQGSMPYVEQDISIRESQYRFSNWARFLRVLTKERPSLDDKLRKRPEIQDKIIRLLDIIRGSLFTVREYQMTSLSEKPDAQSSVGGPGIKTDDIKGMLTAVDESITRLNKLAIAIRLSSRSVTTAISRRFASQNPDMQLKLDVFEERAELALCSLYPNAPTKLRHQLLDTMVDRFARIQYEEYKSNQVRGHFNPSKNRSSFEGSESNTDTPPRAIESQTTHSTQGLQDQRPTVHRPMPPPISSLDSTRLNRNLGLPSVARSSAFSAPKTTVLDTSARTDPPVPNFGEDSKATCEWCFQTIDRSMVEGGEGKSHATWSEKGRRHYAQDLQPYVCISETCCYSRPSFARSKDWLDHMVSTHSPGWLQEVQHQKVWTCPYEQPNVSFDSIYTFSSKEELSHHIHLHHEDSDPARKDLRYGNLNEEHSEFHVSRFLDDRRFQDILDLTKSDPPPPSDEQEAYPASQRGKPALHDDISMAGNHGHKSLLSLACCPFCLYSFADGSDDIDRTKPSNQVTDKYSRDHIISHLHHIMIVSLQIMGAMRSNYDKDEDIESNVSFSVACLSDNNEAGRHWNERRLKDLPEFDMKVKSDQSSDASESSIKSVSAESYLRSVYDKYTIGLVCALPKEQTAATAMLDERHENLPRTDMEVNQTIQAVPTENDSPTIEIWLSAPDVASNLYDATARRHGDSGRWFLDSDAFTEWKSGSRRHLWLHGTPGCGKTVLCSTIISSLTENETGLTIEFFFDFRDENKSTLDMALRSLVWQLSRKSGESRADLEALYVRCAEGGSQPLLEELISVFDEMIRHSNEIRIILDALDECTTRQQLLSWMGSLLSSQHAGVYVLATSRRQEDIESGLGQWISENDTVAITTDLVNKDIESYIQSHISNDSVLQRRWAERPEVLEEISNKVGERSNGIFVLAVCYLHELSECHDYSAIMSILASPTRPLSEMYSHTLENVPETERGNVVKLLQFLIYSKRPLSIDEANDILATDPDRGNFDTNYRLPKTQELTRHCSSLISLQRRYDSDPDARYDAQTVHSPPSSAKGYFKVQLARSSVKDFLTSHEVLEDFQSVFMHRNAYRDMTKICLVYLLSLGSIYTQPPEFHFGESETVRLIAEFPFATYSATYWMDHAYLVCKQQEEDDDVNNLILEFCKNSQAYKLWKSIFEITYQPLARQEAVPIPASPLEYCCLGGLEAPALRLLESFDANALHSEQYTSALCISSHQGHERIVQMLLEHGANVNGGPEQTSALCLASSQGHERIVQMLLEHGANVNGGPEQTSALCLASSQGHERIVQMLLEHGADTNAKDANDDSALHLALKYYHAQTAKVLLQQGLGMGVNISLSNKDGRTPLMLAAWTGDVEILELILELRHEVSVRDNMEMFKIKSAHESVDMNSRDNEGRTARLFAAANGDDNVAAFFQGHERLSFSYPDKDGYTPLDWAVRQSHEGAVNLLLQRGASLSDTHKNWLARHAATFLSDEVYEKLVAFGW